MTREEEILKEMISLYSECSEIGHIKADDLLLELIVTPIGDPEVRVKIVHAFNKLNKWYA